MTNSITDGQNIALNTNTNVDQPVTALSLSGPISDTDPSSHSEPHRSVANGISSRAAREHIKGAIDTMSEAGFADFTRSLQERFAASADDDRYDISQIAIAARDGGENLSDAGNATRFSRYLAAFVRFCVALGWLIWDGKRWATHSEDHIALWCARVVARLIRQEGDVTASDERGKALILFALKSESSRALIAMVKLAKGDPSMTVKPDELDTNPFALNCHSGTIDLRTGTLRGHDPLDLITKITQVEYDPEATCPIFLQFLATVFQGDQGIIEFLQRYIGYCLTGDTREGVLLLMVGNGQNGKSTLIDVLLALLGEYGHTSPEDTFLVKTNGGGINTDVADLAGKRLVVASEIERGRRLSEATVKRITGRTDQLTARHLFKNFATFRPTFKLILASNDVPIISGTDEGIWARIRLLQFNVRFDDLDMVPDSLTPADKGLPQKLRKELPGILNWAIEGCRMWGNDGLHAPPEVLAATADYRAKMDSLAQFLQHYCYRGVRAKVRVSDLHAAYQAWYGQPVNQREFTKNMNDHGFFSKRSTGGHHFWADIDLLIDGQVSDGHESDEPVDLAA